MTQLNEGTRHHLPESVAQPGYDRAAWAPGIVHLGIGAFHRAHQAVYTDDVLGRYGGDWRIIGVSLRSTAVRDALEPQDDLYTVNLCGDTTAQRRLIGAVAKVLAARDQPQAVIDALADPSVRVVTLTITEKGYGLDPSGERLDQTRADVGADLGGQWPPATALGFLAHALERRRVSDLPGLTLISCDNLSGNGRKLKHALLELCQTRDPRLADWIQSTCAFPCTMVDRIVPAARAEQLEQLARTLGMTDAAAVFAEPFRQWVIERHFAGPVPPWDKVGAEFVNDVRPFEEMKLRLLNASHSMLAWIGVVAGIDTIAEAVTVDSLWRMVTRYMHTEARPTLQLPPGYPYERYMEQLLMRFANRALPHRTAQIAVDSSQKLTQRLLPVLRWNLEHNGCIECACLGIAAWLRYSQGIDEHGRAYAVDDPSAAALAGSGQPLRATAWSTALRPLFGDLFERHPRAATAVDAWLAAFERDGIVAATERLHG